jgi:hypothetical protein
MKLRNSANINCQHHRYLECWDDAEYKKGIVSVLQPTLHKLFNSRQAQEILLTWIGNPVSWQNYIRENWTSDYFPEQDVTDSAGLWIETLRNGELVLTPILQFQFPLTREKQRKH